MNKENVLKIVRDYQYRKSVCYPKTHERIYCNLRIYYIISFIYLMASEILLILGLIFSRPNEPRSYLINTAVSAVLFVAAFILMFYKLDIYGLGLNIIGTVYKILPLLPMQIFSSGVLNIETAFYWEHLIPTVLLFIGSIWMSIISTRERVLIRRDKKRAFDQLYQKYHTDDMSEEEWESFLHDFVENYKEQN